MKQDLETSFIVKIPSQFSGPGTSADKDLNRRAIGIFPMMSLVDSSLKRLMRSRLSRPSLSQHLGKAIRHTWLMSDVGENSMYETSQIGLSLRSRRLSEYLLGGNMKTTDIREDDLGQRYQSMGNEELLDRAASGTLTELAQQVADEEIKKRQGDRHAPAGDISFAASSVLPKRKIPWWFLLALLALLQVGHSIIRNWKSN